MSSGGEGPSAVVEGALRALGVRHLVLAIHDASFPGDSCDDIGTGAPASPAGRRLAAFARASGFDALQLGPQGLTDEDDASPYTGALFSRNPMSISLARLSDPDAPWGELLPASRLAALVASRPPGALRRVPYASVFRVQRGALGAAFERFEKRRAIGDAEGRSLGERFLAFRNEAGAWLEADALYEVLRGQYQGRDWPRWAGPHADLDRSLGDFARAGAPAAARRAELSQRYAEAIRFYCFVQLVAHEQHAAFREDTRRLGLSLFGDLQVGISPRDTWRHPGMFLERYRMGAPPSRTNPEGQPWDCPVLDPGAYLSGERPGPAMHFVTSRTRKMFDEYDAVRMDHPQGLVCPWVYRVDEPEARREVRDGARLFSSPDLPDHPELARYAIVRRAQLSPDPATPRYDDHWVVDLEPEQVERYALLFDRVVEVARQRGRVEPALFCEVLSTLPNPLAHVLARHGLGRFRVTQKADLGDPDDVYHAANAEPHDWIMFGNHDTPPLWRLLSEWQADGRLAERAAHAASRLAPSAGERETLRNRLLAEPGLLAHAEIAQLFASPAENVSIFFADLFGLTEVYNRPGSVSSENWTLRLPPDFRDVYARRLCADRALNVPLALWMALRAQPAQAPRELVDALRFEAEAARGGTPLPR